MSVSPNLVYDIRKEFEDTRHEIVAGAASPRGTHTIANRSATSQLQWRNELVNIHAHDRCLSDRFWILSADIPLRNHGMQKREPAASSHHTSETTCVAKRVQLPRSQLAHQFFQPKQHFVAIFFIFVAPKCLPIDVTFDFEPRERRLAGVQA